MSKAVQRKWCTFVNFSPYILGIETFTIWPNSKSFLNLMWLYFFFFKIWHYNQEHRTKNSNNTTVLNTKIYNIYQVFQSNIDLINYILKIPRIKQFASEFRLFANYFLNVFVFLRKNFIFFYEISLVFGNIYVKLVQGREIIRVMHWNRRCSFLVLSRSNGIKTSAIFH